MNGKVAVNSTIDFRGHEFYWSMYLYSMPNFPHFYIVNHGSHNSSMARVMAKFIQMTWPLKIEQLEIPSCSFFSSQTGFEIGFLAIWATRDLPDLSIWKTSVKPLPKSPVVHQKWGGGLTWKVTRVYTGLLPIHKSSWATIEKKSLELFWSYKLNSKQACQSSHTPNELDWHGCLAVW